MISRAEFLKRAGFEDVLSIQAYEYLEERNLAGVQTIKIARMLLRFLRLCSAEGYSTAALSKEAFDAWCQREANESTTNHHHRATAVQRFAKFMASAGYDAYVEDHIRKVPSTFVPYIFNHEEIARLFRATNTLTPTPISANRVPIIQLVFRTLYGCGIRVSEALNLKAKDVDLDCGSLTIWKGKFEQDCVVLLSPSLMDRYTQYFVKIHKRSSPEAPFFPTPAGGHYVPQTMYYAWRQLLAAAGISHGGRGKGPGIHDLRHTFAVHRLQEWIETGADLQVMLPYLSAYMGHTGLSSTQTYLRLIPEMYPNVVSMFEQKFNVIPDIEVCDETD